MEAFKETELRFEAEPGGAIAAALRAQTEHVQTVPCPPPVAAAVMGEDEGAAGEEEEGAGEEQQNER